MKTIGQNIVQARQNAGLDIEQLAQELDVSVFLLSLYEDGVVEPTPNMLREIASLCGADQSLFGL